MSWGHLAVCVSLFRVFPLLFQAYDITLLSGCVTRLMKSSCCPYLYLPLTIFFNFLCSLYHIEWKYTATCSQSVVLFLHLCPGLQDSLFLAQVVLPCVTSHRFRLHGALQRGRWQTQFQRRMQPQFQGWRGSGAVEFYETPVSNRYMAGFCNPETIWQQNFIGVSYVTWRAEIWFLLKAMRSFMVR